MEMLVGDSVASLALLPKQSADVVYLDSDHAYEHVVKELELAKTIVKSGGLIVLNDYTPFDQFRNMPYGVPAACNEFMLREGWEVAYFALHPQMFCDLTIRKM
jgi:cephalosporin hydroxylase